MQPGEREMEGRLRALRSLDGKIRERAIAWLADAGESAIGPLCGFLRDETWDVKPAAADALGRIARQSPSPSLGAALPRLRRELRKVSVWLLLKRFGAWDSWDQSFWERETRKTQTTVQIYRDAISAIESVAVEEIGTLWNDPRGATCPVVPLFRHRAYRLMRPICLLGMPLALIVGGAMADLDGAYAALAACAALLGIIVTSLIVPSQHARLAAVARQARRIDRELRFLCPICLHFAQPLHACGACGKDLEEFVSLTRGLYLNDCAHCHARVYSRGSPAGHAAHARCGRCGEVCDETHHNRRVRVIGTLDAGDVRRLSQSWPDAREVGGEAHGCVIDDGETLIFMLDVAGAARSRRLDDTDAVSNVDALWISGAAADPLALGQALDEYARRTDAMRGLVILVEASSLDPAAQNLLETRCDHVYYGVSGTAALKA